MKKLQVLMPMAGLGSRFSREGYSLPKPLIEVDGMLMFEKALSSIESLRCEKRLIFVIRKDHVDNFNLRRIILEYDRKAGLVVIDSLTAGSVETCMKAESFIDPSEGLLVIDCDLFFASSSFEKIIVSAMEGELHIDGALLGFKSADNRYSYARIEDGFVVQTAEKTVISENALVGAYFFTRGGTFISAAKSLLQKNLNDQMKEYYTSLLYNQILSAGGKVVLAETEQYHSFGTPEELNKYVLAQR